MSQQKMNADPNEVSSQSKENHAASLNKAVEDQESSNEQSGEKRKIDIEKSNWNIIESANFLSPRKSVTKVTKLVLNTKTSTNHNGSGKTKQTPLKKDTKSASTKSLLSVNDQTAKHSNGDKCNDGKTNNNNNNLKVEEFKMKKQDRERLSNEFKECLVENFNKVNSPRPSTVLNNNNNNNNQVMEPPKVVKNVTPSPKKLNSPNDIKVTLPCKKSKNYNPEEAREYIKEQQKKWKIGNEQSKVENKYEKEEIRKRLKDLQEKTTKIVQTNLQKSKRLRSVEKPHNSLGILRRPNLTPDKKQPPSSTSSMNSFVNSKSDDKSSFSATPKSSNSVPSEPRALLFETLGADKEVPPPVKKSDQIKIEDIPEDVDHLEVPHIKLTPNHKSETTSQSSNVSFWLRPSGVQTYPYNFIMAIRKKLEAISEPKINNHKNTNTTKPSPESSSIKPSSSQTNRSLNTASDISSIRSEPLKSQNIFTSTHIENKNNESFNNSTLKSTVNSEEIPEIIPLSKEKIQNMKIAASESSNKKDLSNAEFYKLLESFNKSLSHVIEVNQQLYSSLKNPPASFVNFKRGSVANDQITLKVDESKKTEVEYSENFDQIQEAIEPHDDIEETTIVPILNLNSSSRTSVSNSDNTTTLKAFTDNHKNESSPADINNTTLGSEIFSYFKDLNDTDLENSMINYSEVNLNYSTIGIYDKMIKNEQSKSEHLASLMKMREKSLIDRARGQIAWLEIQKQKFKEAGKREEISSIKKKQRALLMRLDKERANIQRVVKEKGLFQNEKSSVVSLKYKELHSSTSSISIRKRSKSVSSNDNSALKVYDLEGGANLSNLLQQREIELAKRRENVERLLEWHRRLDKEEEHVVEMERQLYEFNLNKINNQHNVTSLSNNNTSNNIKKIKKINRSLKILKNIPSSKGNTSTSEDVLNDESDNVVDIIGAKLNKLWYRLTGRKDRKYDETQIYNITKTELEKMYVEAKRVVLEEGQILNLIDSSRLDLSRGTNTEIETEPEMKNEEEDEIHELTIKSEDHDVHAETTTDFKIETTHIAETHIELEKNTTIEQPPISEIIDSKDSTFTVMHDLEILNSETESEPIASVLNLLPMDLNTTVPSFLEDVSFPNFNDISSAIINLNDNDADDDAAVDNETDNRNSSPKNDKTYDYDSSFDDNTSKLIEEEVENFYISNESSLRSVHENEIETRLIRLDSGLKELSRSFEKIPAELKSPELLSPRSQSRSSSEEKEMIKSELSLAVAESVTSSSDDPNTEQERMDSPILMRNKNINETFPNTSSQHVVITMPDIISEAEVLRRQNIQILDNEKPGTPPFLYLREIPNKPPPPYVPPAHGSQFTSVFPTEDRIIEIVMRRTKELYDIEFHGQMEPDNSIIHENITNVYERIILDVCRELIHDFKVPEPPNTYEQIESFHKNKLSLYNPPNRLHTIQSQVLKKIRRLLYVESQGIRPQTYTFVQGTNKRKRDLVDEILSHELNEEEIKWTNFDVEEMEVKNKVTCEIVQILIDEALNDFEEIYEKQL